jgi:O-antigen/teichoic acid export membrane protein
MLLFGAIAGSQTGALTGFEAFKNIARVQVYVGVATFCLLIIGTLAAGLLGAVVALTVSLFLNCVLNEVELRREAANAGVPLNAEGYWREWRVIWHFSMPAILAGILVAPVNWLCISILVHQPDGYAEMGIVNAANQWRSALVILPATLGTIALPMLSHLHNVGDFAGMRKVFWTSVAVNGTTALLAAVVISAFSPWIMQMYGEGFQGGELVLVVLVLSAALMVTVSVVGQILASSDRMWAGFFLNCGWAFTTIAATWFLRHHGAAGLAMGSFIGYLFHVVAVSTYVYVGVRLHLLSVSKGGLDEVER